MKISKPQRISTMANWYERENSKYIWIQYYDADGMQVRVSTNKYVRVNGIVIPLLKGLKTHRKEAREICKEIEAQRKLNLFQSRYTSQYGGSKNLSSAFQSYLQTKGYRKNEKLSVSSITNCKIAVRYLIKIADDKQVSKYTEFDMEKFEFYLDTKELSQNSQAIYSRHLRAIFNFFIKQKWIKENPIYAIRAEKVKPRSIPFEDMNRIFKYIKKHQPYLFYYNLFLLMSGVRSNEALTVKISDIDFNLKFLRIQNQKAKRQNEIIPLYKEFGFFLKRLIGERNSGLLFNYYKNYEGYQSAWRRPMKAIEKNLRKEKNDETIIFKYQMKQFRKTFATYLLESGLSPHDVQSLLRHTDVRILLEHYAEVKMNRIRDEIDTKVQFFNKILPFNLEDI
ncbi:MAG: tyrosine-type recombinase/integrase [Melioribacteraceae bacterium]|nr:tyrosine-type recombinase/integrase [Melioribacteraceae bacterium]